MLETSAHGQVAVFGGDVGQRSPGRRLGRVGDAVHRHNNVEVVGQPVYDGRPDAAAGGGPADHDGVHAEAPELACQVVAEEGGRRPLLQHGLSLGGLDQRVDPAGLAAAQVLDERLGLQPPDARIRVFRVIPHVGVDDRDAPLAGGAQHLAGVLHRGEAAGPPGARVGLLEVDDQQGAAGSEADLASYAVRGVHVADLGQVLLRGWGVVRHACSGGRGPPRLVAAAARCDGVRSAWPRW